MKLTPLQVAVPVVAPLARRQVGGLTEPTPITLKFTLPVGVTVVPAGELSVTVAVQLDAWFTVMELPQVTDVEVICALVTTTLTSIVWMRGQLVPVISTV